MLNIPAMPSLTGPFDPFPERGSDSFASVGDADGWRRPTLPDIQLSFYGSDPATVVWRSAPIVVGSVDDTFGVPLGPNDSTITSGGQNIRVRPQLPIDSLAGAGARRKVMTELHSLHLTGDGAEVMAGEAFLTHLRDNLNLSESDIATIFNRSYGEVISWDMAGDSTHDFPADNYFNVFFAIKVFATANNPEFTVFNKIPMLVVDQGIVSMPPLGRVTIPQFPLNLTELYYVKDPSDPTAPLGQTRALSGNCCAHALEVDGRWGQGAIDFGSILQQPAANVAVNGAGISLGNAAVVAAGTNGPPTGLNAGFTHVANSSYIDGIFVPSGTSQISSDGTLVQFAPQAASNKSNAIRNGVSAVDPNGTVHQIFVTPSSAIIPYQPPQLVGIGMGTNSGITFDIAALRDANPDFYLIEFVAFEGMSAESSADSSIRLRAFVDGVEVLYADNTFTTPGASAAIRIDLQRAIRFLTLTAMPTGLTVHVGNGVFAGAEFRGFGRTAVGNYLQYWKDPNYAGATGNANGPNGAGGLHQ